MLTCNGKVQSLDPFSTSPPPSLPPSSPPAPASTPVQCCVVMQWKEMWIAPRNLATSRMLTSSYGRWSSYQPSSALLLCLSPSGKVPPFLSWHEDEQLIVMQTLRQAVSRNIFMSFMLLCCCYQINAPLIFFCTSCRCVVATRLRRH